MWSRGQDDEAHVARSGECSTCDGLLFLLMLAKSVKHSCYPIPISIIMVLPVLSSVGHTDLTSPVS